jgi:FkbM family methyltransferase
MLIPLHDMVVRNNINITGVLHVGAHEGEENSAYLAEGVAQQDVHWIEAIPELCTTLSKRLPNVTQAVVSDKVERVDFNITNNFQSSSILNLKTHIREHPHIYVTRRISTMTTTLDTIVDAKQINANFLNMDIQGAELKCLKGFEKNLAMIEYIYTEVNENELYEGCALLPELDEWLGVRGFDRKEISMTPHGWGDALYLRRSGN